MYVVGSELNTIVKHKTEVFSGYPIFLVISVSKFSTASDALLDVRTVIVLYTERLK